MPMDCTLATCDHVRDLDPDDRVLLERLTMRGIKTSIAVWTDTGVDWAGTRLCVLRSTWDYHTRFNDFVHWIDRVARSTTVWNHPSLLKWSADKAYLEELRLLGVPVVPTFFVKRGESADLKHIGEGHGWHEMVIKPARGSAAQNILRVKLSGAALECAQLHLDRLALSHGALLQPYQKAVAAYGERALVFLGGHYSHAVVKKPFDTRMAVGDARCAVVQPTSEEIAVASNALRLVPGQPIYARVDLLPGEGGEVFVNEVELVEPALYLRVHDAAVTMFADLIERQLTEIPMAAAQTVSAK
ncbi:MAG: hypothetical protein WAL67_10305 [Candidatus Cybelea sp.]